MRKIGSVSSLECLEWYASWRGNQQRCDQRLLAGDLFGEAHEEHEEKKEEEEKEKLAEVPVVVEKLRVFDSSPCNYSCAGDEYGVGDNYGEDRNYEQVCF